MYSQHHHKLLFACYYWGLMFWNVLLQKAHMPSRRLTWCTKHSATAVAGHIRQMFWYPPGSLSIHMFQDLEIPHPYTRFLNMGTWVIFKIPGKYYNTSPPWRTVYEDVSHEVLALRGTAIDAILPLLHESYACPSDIAGLYHKRRGSRWRQCQGHPPLRCWWAPLSWKRPLQNRWLPCCV